ncbi:MAG: hypothetical protein PHD55_11750, partial [Methanoregula sp.]|nr:hypothetical protein [Methanoregula sp.]
LSGIVIPDKGTIHVDGKVTGLLEPGTGFNAEMTGLRKYLHERHAHRHVKGQARPEKANDHRFFRTWRFHQRADQDLFIRDDNAASRSRLQSMRTRRVSPDRGMIKII